MFIHCIECRYSIWTQGLLLNIPTTFHPLRFINWTTKLWTTINQQEPIFWSKPLRVERKFMGRGIGKVFLIHFFLITHQSNYLVFRLGTSSMLHLMVLCTCTNALSKTEITTLTSQNSPSSYNASSLKGSKNGCLTMTPVKKLPSTFLFKISHDKRVRERYISLKINRLSAL